MKEPPSSACKSWLKLQQMLPVISLQHQNELSEEHRGLRHFWRESVHLAAAVRVRKTDTERT